MATWTLELTTQVKYVSPPGAKFITAHLCRHATPVMPLALSAYLKAGQQPTVRYADKTFGGCTLLSCVLQHSGFEGLPH